MQIGPNTRSNSPCNGFCIIDDKTGFCRGCFRTLSEIVGWGSMSEQKKVDVRKKIEKRKKNLSAN